VLVLHANKATKNRKTTVVAKNTNYPLHEIKHYKAYKTFLKNWNCKHRLN